MMPMLETQYRRQQSKHKNLFCSRSCMAKSLWDSNVITNVTGRIQSNL